MTNLPLFPTHQLPSFMERCVSVAPPPARRPSASWHITLRCHARSPFSFEWHKIASKNSESGKSPSCEHIELRGDYFFTLSVPSSLYCLLSCAISALRAYAARVPIGTGRGDRNSRTGCAPVHRSCCFIEALLPARKGAVRLMVSFCSLRRFLLHCAFNHILMAATSVGVLVAQVAFCRSKKAP